MPIGWKSEPPVQYNYVYMDTDLEAEDYVSFFQLCRNLNIPNPRIFSPRILSFASVLHPSLFFSVKYGESTSNELNAFKKSLVPMELTFDYNSNTDLDSPKFYFQSLAFLSGVTLSAAIIQNRYSEGTIESKLNRLWQLATASGQNDILGLNEIDIKQFVLKTANKLNGDKLNVLVDIKKFYSTVLKKLVKDIDCEWRCLKADRLSKSQKVKYGFIDSLKSDLGSNLQCVILYGSAVNSQKFSDYDLILIVKNLDSAINALAGKSPIYRGLELNISLFDEDDFITYQLASGDNLIDHALCLYGETNVPHKTSNLLLTRNFSFGFIRFRQQIGVSAYVNDIKSRQDDKKNLLDYFIKIPLNVSKGIEGCFGQINTNEELRYWFKETLGFDVDFFRAESAKGNHNVAIAVASWATETVMYLANLKYGFCKPAYEQSNNLLIEKLI